MVTKAKRASLFQKALRGRGPRALFEPLDQRILLAATVTWNPAVPAGDWSIGGNWMGGSVPAAGDDVVFNSSATVKVNQNYGAGGKLGSLKVHGSANVDLQFAINNANFQIAHDITLDQTSGCGANLTLGIFEAALNMNTATIKAARVALAGEVNGWNDLCVDVRTKLELSGSIITWEYMFGLVVNGTMTLDSGDFMGKNLTDASAIIVNGNLTASGQLTIGGRGIVSNGGVLNIRDLRIDPGLVGAASGPQFNASGIGARNVKHETRNVGTRGGEDVSGCLTGWRWAVGGSGRRGG